MQKCDNSIHTYTNRTYPSVSQENTSCMQACMLMILAYTSIHKNGSTRFRARGAAFVERKSITISFAEMIYTNILIHTKFTPKQKHHIENKIYYLLL